jgi:hypothetical protein
MKKFIITENQLEFIVKRYINEDARYVMSFDEYMKHKNKDQQYKCGYENLCFLIHDGNHQINLDEKFHEEHKIPNGVGGTIYHDGNNVYFCPNFGDDRPQRTIEVY